MEIIGQTQNRIYLADNAGNTYRLGAQDGALNIMFPCGKEYNVTTNCYIYAQFKHYYAMLNS